MILIVPCKASQSLVILETILILLLTNILRIRLIDSLSHFSTSEGRTEKES